MVSDFSSSKTAPNIRLEFARGARPTQPGR
jgi:hypothetical protein